MPGRNRSKRSGQADREKRTSKVIQAWRMVDPEISARLSGTMHELERGGAIPELTQVWSAHKVFIVDPRLVREEMSAGFELGYNFSKAIDGLYKRVGVEDEGPKAKLGEVVLKGSPNKRLITLELLALEKSDEHYDPDIPDIASERARAYSVLGDVGMRGFQNQRRNKKRCAGIDIVLAKTNAPMRPESKIINDGFDPRTDEVSQDATIEAIHDALTEHKLYDEIVEFSKMFIRSDGTS